MKELRKIEKNPLSAGKPRPFHSLEYSGSINQFALQIASIDLFGNFIS